MHHAHLYIAVAQIATLVVVIQDGLFLRAVINNNEMMNNQKKYITIYKNI